MKFCEDEPFFLKSQENGIKQGEFTFEVALPGVMNEENFISNHDPAAEDEVRGDNRNLESIDQNNEPFGTNHEEESVRRITKVRKPPAKLRLLHLLCIKNKEKEPPTHRTE